jgi:hypothetical protein
MIFSKLLWSLIPALGDDLTWIELLSKHLVNQKVLLFILWEASTRPEDLGGPFDESRLLCELEDS